MSYGYYKIGFFKEVFGVKDFMERKGMFFIIEMYNILIFVVFKCRYLNKVIDFVIELGVRGLIFIVVIYGVFIIGWCNIGVMDKVYVMCFEMIEKGIDVNVNICSKIVISLFCFDKIDEVCLLLYKFVDFDFFFLVIRVLKSFLNLVLLCVLKYKELLIFLLRSF